MVIDANTRVVAAPRQVSADLRGEAAILDLRTGVYFGLNEVGARVWALVQQPKRVADVCDALCAEFEVEPARCHRDVVALLEEMARHGLVVTASDR